MFGRNTLNSNVHGGERSAFAAPYNAVAGPGPASLAASRHSAATSDEAASMPLSDASFVGNAEAFHRAASPDFVHCSVRGRSFSLAGRFFSLLPAGNTLAATLRFGQPGYPACADGRPFVQHLRPSMLHSIIDFYENGRQLVPALEPAQLNQLRAVGLHYGLHDLVMECEEFYPLRAVAQAALDRGDNVEARACVLQLAGRLIARHQFAEARGLEEQAHRLQEHVWRQEAAYAPAVAVPAHAYGFPMHYPAPATPRVPRLADLYGPAQAPPPSQAPFSLAHPMYPRAQAFSQPSPTAALPPPPADTAPAWAEQLFGQPQDRPSSLPAPHVTAVTAVTAVHDSRDLPTTHLSPQPLGAEPMPSPRSARLRSMHVQAVHVARQRFGTYAARPADDAAQSQTPGRTTGTLANFDGRADARPAPAAVMLAADHHGAGQPGPSTWALPAPAGSGASPTRSTASLGPSPSSGPRSLRERRRPLVGNLSLSRPVAASPSTWPFYRPTEPAEEGAAQQQDNIFTLAQMAEHSPPAPARARRLRAHAQPGIDFAGRRRPELAQSSPPLLATLPDLAGSPPPPRTPSN